MTVDDSFAQKVTLTEVKLNEHIAGIKQQYTQRYGDKAGSGVYSRYDWARVSYVFDLLHKGGRVLDVGVGSGQFVNALAMSGSFPEIVGVDVTTHTKFIRLTDAYELQHMSVAELRFPTDSFDVVVCMEVLEHIDRRTFLAGLRELRRVCRDQLVMTVPFDEPLPLPSYHKQRFDQTSITELWPTASRQLLQRPGVSWLLMEETRPVVMDA